MYEEMLNELVELQRAMLDKDELFEIAAQTAKKAYDALIKVGFNEEQATTIIAAKGGPNISSK